MKPVDERLNRLMKSAAQAPQPAPGEAKLGLETRVLAQWRSALRNESGEFLVSWFRRVAVCAGLLAIASVAWNFYNFPDHRSSAEMVADSAMSMGVEP